MTESQHIPVLAEEVLRSFAHMRAPKIIDGTLGLGGHSAMLLDKIPDSRILGIDRDDVALRQAGQRLALYGDRVLLFRGAFSEMADFAAEAEWESVDGILLDVGVSSPQIDTPARGFSHRFDGPLDMRMDRRSQETAATILNSESVEELADIFFHYGEERHARRVARAVVRRREEKPWSRTAEFAELVEHVVGHAKHGPPPATRCFQALRIAVNDELGELDRALAAAVPLLGVGGRLAVISFHSLEDRIVKQFFRHEASDCICPPEIPVCVCDKVATLRLITRKPITASPEEREANRRAASAKLRVAEKLAPSAETAKANRPNREEEIAMEATRMQKLAIKGPKRTGARPRPAAGKGTDVQFWLLAVVLVLLALGITNEYVRRLTEQVKMGRQLEHLVARHSEQEKTLSNLDAKVQKYQSNTRYIEQAIRDFHLDLRGNTQANVVKVDAYGSVLRQHPQGAGHGVFAEASR